MKDAIPTAYNMPILGDVYQDDDGEFQFAGHEFFINDDNEIEYEEAPVGCIPESADLKLVHDEGDDKSYLEGTGIIWRTYSKAADIIEREQQLYVSVELVVDDLSFDSNSKELVIDKFRFSGVTILGKDRNTGDDIMPGMEKSNISIADFSEKNNIEIVTFGRCTGLRRRELSRIRGSALSEIGDSFYLSVKDGTKGKRERTVRITGTPEEVALVVRLCRESGDRRIFPRVPHNMDEHSYRREYANRIYQFYKRPLWALSRNQKYYCRGDLRGVVYDRRALYRASEALGHSRLCIIPSNYAPDP